MGQLQLFTATELATMRDRTRARKYSPQGEEFRRVHQRHRAWGLAQRHAQRLQHLRERQRDTDQANTAPEIPLRAVSPLARPTVPTIRAQTRSPYSNRDDT
jgi:hypothetical protein